MRRLAWLAPDKLLRGRDAPIEHVWRRRELSLHHSVLIIAVGTFTITESALAASVTLNPGSINSQLVVRAFDDTVEETSVFPTALPLVASDEISAGPSINTSLYDLQNGGFGITFEHSRTDGASEFAFAQSSGNIFFSVDHDVPYSITGAYSATNAEALLLEVALLERPTSSILALSEQESRSTVGEDFLLGGNGGDYRNAFEGSLTGVLTAGVEYQLRYNAAVGGLPLAAEGGSANGFVRLALLPEPTTFLLLGTGLLSLALTRRRNPSFSFQSTSRPAPHTAVLGSRATESTSSSAGEPPRFSGV